MKTGEQMAAWLADTIRHIYERPEMYGDTPSEVESALWQYHSFWAEITESDKFITIRADELMNDKQYKRARRSYRHFSRHPDGARQLFGHVIDYWKRVDQRLGVST